MILRNFIPMLGAYFGGGMGEAWFFPVMALAFVATVPCIFKYLLR